MVHTGVAHYGHHIMLSILFFALSTLKGKAVKRLAHIAGGPHPFSTEYFIA